MLTKKLPDSDEERLGILQTILDQEEIIDASDRILSITEFHDLRQFTTSFEATVSVFSQAVENTEKAKNLYDDLFKNAQLYISHFIQVLFLTVIRNEIRTEQLTLYGFPEDNPVLPDLSTEELVLKWGENLMRGESERTYRGGIPLYNPAIAKVKVHYELFKEAIYSLSIYEKNLFRLQKKMDDLREKADNLIFDIWSKVEEKYINYSSEAQTVKFKAYKIQLLYRKGDQLNVFDI